MICRPIWLPTEWAALFTKAPTYFCNSEGFSLPAAGAAGAACAAAA